MPELLKNRYNYDSLFQLASSIKDAYSLFPVDDFIAHTMDETWDNLELKERMRQITINLRRYLPSDYQEALTIIDKVVANYPPGFNDFTLMYFPDFVEVYGQDQCHWDLSIAALARYTVSSSSEFAVRPFIIKQEQRMMQQMLLWSKHENEHVRRLASEGCRPQLPWGQALTSFKKDPTQIIRILEQLKTDSSLYVRKSVANNLNDISKTHPELIIKIAKEWHGKNKDTDWILKHGCRTLLKQGNKNVLNIFGFTKPDSIHIDSFALDSKNILMGENITFSFNITTKSEAKIRLEYGIDYVKANGKRNRKIFQISQIFLKENQQKNYIKKHSLVDMSSRKHYAGLHSITLIVNGTEYGTLDFEVSKR